MDDRAAALSLTPVSCETLDRLDAYAALLTRWQARINLVAPSTLPQLWSRHIADSLQILARAPAARTWLDIGSGGGFPGIVIACALAEQADTHVHLVERNGRKAAFLREALRVTAAPGTVHLGDIGDCGNAIPPAIDAVTARAVAPLTGLIRMAKPWLKTGATGLFLKGQDVEKELKNIPTYSSLEIERYASLTGDGWVVAIKCCTAQSPTKHQS